MKNKIVLLFFLLTSISAFSQFNYTRQLGTTFDYSKDEKDLKVVLVDNYNHFMFSVININGGMMPTNKLIIRKFDQKNQLVDTFMEEFPHKDIFTLHNYLGSFEISNEKLLVLTDTYSNKSKKKEIHKIIFDKKTGTFDTTLVSEFTFESISKSGTAFAMVSQNKNHIGIVYSKFANRKVAEEHECAVIDGRTGDLVWKKNVSFPLLSFTDNIVLNDSGKFIFVKTTKETGSKNVLAIADGNTIENKDFGSEDVKILKPLSFSVGANDYLLAFNNYAHGINHGEYDKILLYDVNAGKVLKNNLLDNFKGIKDLYTVNFNTLSVHNNEINVFVDCDIQTGTKPDPTFPGSSFKVPVYSNGSPSLLVFSMDGELKNSVNFNVMSFQEKTSKCIGVQNIKGNFYVNTYYPISDSYYYQLYKFPFSKDVKREVKYGFGESFAGDNATVGMMVPQFWNYLPEAKKLILARSYAGTKMTFFSVQDIQL